MDSTSVEARVRRLLTTAFLLVSWASAGEAPEAVPVYEIDAGSLSIDGSLEDWRRLSIPPSVTEQDLSLLPYPQPAREVLVIPPPGAPELTFEVRLAWSAEPSRIFAAYEIADDDPHIVVPGDTWPERFTDYVGLAVDGDNGDGQFTMFEQYDDDCYYTVELAMETEEWDCIPGLYYNQRIAQYYEVFPVPDGFVLWVHDISRTWTRLGFDPWVLEDGSSTAVAGRVESGVSTRTTIEVMVTPFDDLDFRGPEHSTPSRLRAGETIGLVVIVVDAEPGQGQKHFYRLGDNSYPGTYAESFSDALLVPADRRTSVETTTWGGLKRETSED